MNDTQGLTNKCSMRSIRWRFLQSNSSGSKEPTVFYRRVQGYENSGENMDARKGKAILSPACERSHENFLEQPAKLAFTYDPGYSLSDNRLTIYY